jgi:hypothetical protein
VLDRGGSDGDAIDQQRAGVVEQALAFEDLENTIGQIDLAQDRRRRRRVGRRHDGAKRDRRRPRHVRQQPVDQHRYRGGGETYRDEYQRRDRQPVVAEVAHRGVECGVQQDRGHEQRQRQIGLQRPGRT